MFKPKKEIKEDESEDVEAVEVDCEEGAEIEEKGGGADQNDEGRGNGVDDNDDNDDLDAILENMGTLHNENIISSVYLAC